jgi:hypothetical protein
MPRKSAKDVRVDELEVILRERKEVSDTRFLMDMPCEVEYDMDVVYHEEYEKVTSSRYLDRKKYVTVAIKKMNPPVTQIIASHLLFLFGRAKKFAANQRPGFLQKKIHSPAQKKNPLTR